MTCSSKHDGNNELIINDSNNSGANQDKSTAYFQNIPTAPCRIQAGYFNHGGKTQAYNFDKQAGYNKLSYEAWPFNSVINDAFDIHIQSKVMNWGSRVKGEFPEKLQVDYSRYFK